MSANEGWLCEVFASFQGEGLYVGERQIFIRFAGCNLSCQYCDTPQALATPKSFKIETVPGSKKFDSLDNPVTAEKLIGLISQMESNPGLNHSISLTGGEPLLQVDFLKVFIPSLKEKIALPVYLETNGVLYQHLAEIIDEIDMIAMDIKVPSATGLSPFWKEHRQALVVAEKKQVFVKIVFTGDTRMKEMIEAFDLIAEVNKTIPLVLQPVTPGGTVKHRPAPEMIHAFYNAARRKLDTVRVIPQVHKLLGVY